MNIKLFVMDVDGTLTDGKIYIGPSGEMVKAFHVKDGYGIHNILPQLGVIPVILTGRESEIVEVRSRELGVSHIIQGSRNKIEDLSLLLRELSLEWSHVAYIGDDLNDFQIIQKVAWAACPCDAVEEIKEICHFVAIKEGGAGAVREAIDYLKTHLESENEER